MLMLPKAHYLPASPRQHPIRITIALDVRLDFLAPPGSVVTWPTPVFGTTVPKAAVYENDDLQPREREIGSAPAARYRPFRRKS